MDRGATSRIDELRYIHEEMHAGPHCWVGDRDETCATPPAADLTPSHTPAPSLLPHSCLTPAGPTQGLLFDRQTLEPLVNTSAFGKALQLFREFASLSADNTSFVSAAWRTAVLE